MGHSQPSPFSAAFGTPAPNSFRYNTSQYGSVVPVLWGTHRVSVNLIDAYGFTGSNGSSKGGKGGGGGSSGGKKGSSTPTYTVNVAFGLCEGPVTFEGAQNLAAGGYNVVWSNGGIAFFNTVGLSGYLGTAGQAADPVFAAGDPNQPVPGYSNTAYVTGTPMQLGQTPSLPSIQFQLGGRRVGTAGTSFPDDARPDFIAGDLLADANIGAGLPATNLADLSQWGLFCQAQGLAASLLCDRQDSAARWLAQLVEATLAGAFFSGTQLKIVPLASTALSGNGASWTPNLVADYALTDADFLNWEDEGLEGPSNARGGARRDPIEISRKDPAEQPNWLSIEYQPAAYWYDTEVARAFDQAAISAYGLRLEPSRPGHFWTNSTSAQASVQLQLQRAQSNLNQYRFRLNISKCLIEPMDILELTETVSGLAAWPVRVAAVEEDDRNTIIVTAEDLFLYNGGVTVMAQTHSKGKLPLDQTTPPGPTFQPCIFEPPPALTNGQNEIWIGATGGPEWGGCEVWLSLDGTTYSYEGQIFAGARLGFVTAAFPAGSDPDTTNHLTVAIEGSNAPLSGTTHAQADAFATLCLVDQELVSFSTVVALGGAQFKMTDYIRRGGYGTTIASHNIGSRFARLDKRVGHFAYPPNLQPGQNFFVKLPAFNNFGAEKEDLSAAQAWSYQTQGAIGGGGVYLYVAGDFDGKPAAGDQLQKYLFAVQCAVQPALSQGNVDVAPTADAVFTIMAGGVSIGTMTFPAGQTTAVFAISPMVAAKGQHTSVIAPTPQDATLKTPSWSIVWQESVTITLPTYAADIAAGDTPIDLGLASVSPTETEDWGLASQTPNVFLDMGSTSTT